MHVLVQVQHNTNSSYWCCVHVSEAPCLISTLLRRQEMTNAVLYLFLQGCLSTSDISHRLIEFAKCPFDFSMERTNVPLLSCYRGHCPVIFCNSWTLHSRSCERLVAHGLSLHPTDKYSHSCLFLASFTQRWPLSGTGLWCRIG